MLLYTHRIPLLSEEEMMKKKTLKELTIKNNFMFGAVMCDEDNCKEFLEMVLQIPIERVEVSKEKSSLLPQPDRYGIDTKW